MEARQGSPVALPLFCCKSFLPLIVLGYECFLHETRRLMRRCILLFVALSVVFWVALCSCATAPAENTSPLNWEIYFSPNGGRTDAIVRELDKAQSTLLVQAYSFTSYKIAKALLDAHKRGARVGSSSIRARGATCILRQTS